MLLRKVSICAHHRQEGDAIHPNSRIIEHVSRTMSGIQADDIRIVIVCANSLYTSWGNITNNRHCEFLVGSSNEVRNMILLNFVQPATWRANLSKAHPKARRPA